VLSFFLYKVSFLDPLCDLLDLMAMKRKACPSCNKTLPLFLFSANRRISADKDGVTFTCPNCKTTLRANSNEAHQKNFIMIFLVPLLFTPLFISLHAIIPAKIRPLYYFAVYMGAVMYMVLNGQHKMDIVIKN
jgi:predicted RNA-binding Zn-ribbon protein involved in translation (DUF1610 family)